MAKVAYGSLTFEEQLRFFRQKLNLPTASWTDIWQAQHDRSFVVAGAAQEDLLNDLREAVDKAISEGTTLAEFRKDFDRIVAERGWTGFTGEGSDAGMAWRARVIYDTNLRSSYAAGRFEQMKAIAHRRPYWRYRHSDAVVTPRPQHLAWDGLVLPADDPFWNTHYPPNGWGCQCYVESLAERDLKRLGLDGPNTAPEIEYEDKVVGKNGPNPRTVRVPKGIDPGFGYAPGQSLTETE